MITDHDLKLCIKAALPSLISIGDPALVFFTRLDLLDEDPADPADLQDLPEVQELLAQQQPEGYWNYPGRGKTTHPSENYQILQTYRVLGILIDQYGLERSSPAIARAAEFIFSHQSQEGDIRGIFGSQYVPHYTAGIIELLIKAGYLREPQIQQAFLWFQNNCQEDGGWAWPLRTANIDYSEAIEMDSPVQPERIKPFSHALTGFVIRIYASHPDFRNKPLALQAGKLLKRRFFQPDKYPDRKAAAYWLKFQYPFWWGNLLTSLDSLSKLGFSSRDPEIGQGIRWFLENQMETGFWPTGYGKGKRAELNQAWVALAVCRMLKAFSSAGEIE
jgi:hypothetical protein